jgi:hypothetical protein
MLQNMRAVVKYKSLFEPKLHLYRSSVSLFDISRIACLIRKILVTNDKGLFENRSLTLNVVDYQRFINGFRTLFAQPKKAV